MNHVVCGKAQRSPKCSLVPNILVLNRDLFSFKLTYALSRLPTPVQADSIELIKAYIVHLVFAISSSAAVAKIPAPCISVKKEMHLIVVKQSQCSSEQILFSPHSLIEKKKTYKMNCNTAVAKSSINGHSDRSSRRMFRESARDGDVFRALSDFTGKSKSIPLSSVIRIDGTHVISGHDS